MYREIEIETGIGEILQSNQVDVSVAMTETPYLLVLRCHGGWNILLWEAQQGLINKQPPDELFEVAIQSNDIAHYLLVEALLPASCVMGDVYTLVYKMLTTTPQHLGFFLTRFPEEVTSQIDELVSDADLTILVDCDYNKYTRRFFSIILPYLDWSEEVYQELRDNKMSTYLGLDKALAGGGNVDKALAGGGNVDK
jgi:hypothetical protein